MRIHETDPSNSEMDDIQLIQNKLLRFLNGSKLKDMISTKSMLIKMNLLSINQTNAQIKLIEMWKATNIEDYPIEVKKQEYSDNTATTRACTAGRFIETGKKCITLKVSLVMPADCGTQPH